MRTLLIITAKKHPLKKKYIYISKVDPFFLFLQPCFKRYDYNNFKNLMNVPLMFLKEKRMFGVIKMICSEAQRPLNIEMVAARVKTTATEEKCMYIIYLKGHR